MKKVVWDSDRDRKKMTAKGTGKRQGQIDRDRGIGTVTDRQLQGTGNGD